MGPRLPGNSVRTAPVASYHLYWLDDHGRVRGEEQLDANDDEIAIATARAMKRQMQCELWGNGRQLAIIPPHWEP
jgi:hypothetical protein